MRLLPRPIPSRIALEAHTDRAEAQRAEEEVSDLLDYLAPSYPCAHAFAAVWIMASATVLVLGFALGAILVA